MKSITIAVHNGDFHPDDVWAAATLFIAAERGFLKSAPGVLPHIVRTRDEVLIKNADIVVDVGGEDDAARFRFDHHQKGGAGARPNTIPYASFGLVWKHFGEMICGDAAVAAEIDRRIVSPIDASDNGITTWKPVFENVGPYAFDNVIFAFRPTWKEASENIDELFGKAVSMVKALLEREIVCTRDIQDGRALIEKIYQESADKRVIVFDKKYPYTLLTKLSEHPKPLFTVCPNEADQTWHVKAVGTGEAFANRKNLPAAWAGKRGAELAEATGVADALFCHNAAFLIVAKSKESALKLAQLAVES